MGSGLWHGETEPFPSILGGKWGSGEVVGAGGRVRNPWHLPCWTTQFWWQQRGTCGLKAASLGAAPHYWAVRGHPSSAAAVSPRVLQVMVPHWQPQSYAVLGVLVAGCPTAVGFQLLPAITESQSSCGAGGWWGNVPSLLRGSAVAQQHGRWALLHFYS